MRRKGAAVYDPFVPRGIEAGIPHPVPDSDGTVQDRKLCNRFNPTVAAREP